MFEVGDLVVGKEEHSSEYSITTSKENFVGEVLEIRQYLDCPLEIRVKVVECDMSGCIGDRYWVEARFFEHQKSNLMTMRRLKNKKLKRCRK